MIRNERLTAEMEGDFVVFLIGVRINAPLKVHKWLPVLRAMPRMLAELSRQPELGLLHADMWLSRTVSPGSYESVYVNMPAFGLGRAGTLQAASGDRSSAAGRRRSTR